MAEPIHRLGVAVDEEHVAWASEAAAAPWVEYGRDEQAHDPDAHEVTDRHGRAIAAFGESSVRIGERGVRNRCRRQPHADEAEREQQRPVRRRRQRVQRQPGGCAEQRGSDPWFDSKGARHQRHAGDELERERCIRPSARRDVRMVVRLRQAGDQQSAHRDGARD